MLWGALSMSIVYGFLNAISMRSDHMFFLSNQGTGIFLLLIGFMSINPLFLNGNYGIGGLKGQPVNSLEFFFSKAIKRSSLFYVKASLYLCLTLMPLLTVWAYSYTRPVIRIELPYTLAGREATKQFYLSHFEGAYVQKDEQDKESNKAFVVLPKGQVNLAVFTLFWVFLATLLFQIMLLGFPVAIRWVSIPIYVALIFLTSWGGASSMKTPSNYETGLAWVAQHTFLAFLILGISTTLAQVYCCRRFVQTEITS